MTEVTVQLKAIAVSRERAAIALGMKLTSFETYVQPHVRMIRKGKLRLVPVTELERWAGENAEFTLRDTGGRRRVGTANGRGDATTPPGPTTRS